MSESPLTLAGKALFVCIGAAIVLLTLFVSTLLSRRTPVQAPAQIQQERVISSTPATPPPPASSYGIPENPPPSIPQTFSQDSIRQLVAPIALYPDALLALILPASTVPSDIVLASRYLSENGDPGQIPVQPWDSSVQSLANYPQIISWMDQNLAWTTTLGQAFIAQQNDVMNTIQQLREQARNSGNLVTTPQQLVFIDNSVTRIIPADPEHIYVPVYDPEIVYTQLGTEAVTPIVTFGIILAVGPWLNYDCDWHRHELYHGTWQPGWNSAPLKNGATQGINSSPKFVNILSGTARTWHPSAAAQLHATLQQHHFSPSLIPSSLRQSGDSKFVSSTASTVQLRQPSRNASQLPGSTLTGLTNGSSHNLVVTPSSLPPTLNSEGTSHFIIPTLQSQPPHTQQLLTHAPDYSRNTETQEAARHELAEYSHPPSHSLNGNPQEQLSVPEAKPARLTPEYYIPADKTQPVHQNAAYDAPASKSEMHPPISQAHQVITPVEAPGGRPTTTQENPPQRQSPDKNSGDKKKDGQN